MDTFYEIKPGLLKTSALALGFFDGVHPGHQVVIRKAVEEAARLNAIPAVVTFKEHPRSLTLGRSPQLLTLIDQRLELFAELGVKAALVLSFTEELCRLAPEDYVKSVLVDCMGAASLSVGYNHRFGRNRVGDPALLAKLGEEFGYSVHVAREVILQDLEVSSSRIRQAVSEGQVDIARKLLTRPYAILGEVVKGDGRGRQLGFPTANLKVSDEQVMPAAGVYYGHCRTTFDQVVPCVVNIGFRPTVSDEMQLTTEAHLLGFNGDLYGKTLSVSFEGFLRGEKKFASLDELKEQIANDCSTALSRLRNGGGEPSSQEKQPAQQH